MLRVTGYDSVINQPERTMTNHEINEVLGALKQLKQWCDELAEASPERAAQLIARERQYGHFSEVARIAIDLLATAKAE
jgi:hypothetical protein